MWEAPEFGSLRTAYKSSRPLWLLEIFLSTFCIFIYSVICLYMV